MKAKIKSQLISKKPIECINKKPTETKITSKSQLKAKIKMANGKLKAKIKSQLKDNITKQLTAKEKGQNHTAWGHHLKT